MRITSVEVGLYKIPSRHIQENSIARFTAYEWTIVRLKFSNNIEGIGWTYTQGRGGSSIFHLITDYWAKELLSEGDLDPLTLNKKVWSLTYSYGLEGLSRLAYSAIDIALWDGLAKSHDLPLYEMLGGPKSPKVKAYRSAIDLNFSIEELVDDVKKFKNMGFKAFKIKVGKPNFEEDIERIKAVKEVIGSYPLMVDVNRGWNFQDTIRRGKVLYDLGVYWLEEPIEADLLDQYKMLREKLDIPIAAGESLYNGFEQTRLIIEKCVDIVQLDVLRSGGITEWMKYAKLAESLGLPMAPHFGEEISVQVLSAIKNALFLEHLPGSNLNDSGVLKSSLKFEDGYAIPPDKAGHGIEFDWEKLSKYQVLYSKIG
ncbi:mandelate racemase/muconate lactonizing enzyme family protein [Sulfolobus tengchongensis]|uniref:Mandelate racemase/muconate lactonizing enzyme family protein n=1 Tax=Sulfolobus tengchongensis TaxID=207809 RepID=A0AAX4L081_9CREN